MFHANIGTELEGGCLRNWRIFQLGKRKKTMTTRGSCITNRGEDYELTLHFDEGSCDEEEEYQPISKREEE